MAVKKYKVRTRRGPSVGIRLATFLLIAMLGVYLGIGILWFRDMYQSKDASPTISPAAGVSPAPTSAPERITSDVAFPKYDFYAIQFGAFESLEEAQAEAPRYTNRGAAGYVLSNTRHRVLGAAYRSRTDADNVKEQLSAQEIESYVYTVSEPKLTLRVTGTEAQIAAITDSCAELRTLIDELGTLAFEVDRGEKDMTDASATLRSIAARATAVRTALEGELHNAAHPATDGLLDQLRALNETCEILYSENTQSTMAFTSKIKYNSIDLMWRHAQYLQGLSEVANKAASAETQGVTV